MARAWLTVSWAEGVLTFLLAMVNLAHLHEISKDLVVQTTKGKIRGFDTKVRILQFRASYIPASVA